MLLHTLNALPGGPAFQDCLRLLRETDSLLLLGDGVYALRPGTAAADALARSGAELFVLRQDALAAGLDPDACAATAIDMAGFVELTERHTRQLAWF